MAKDVNIHIKATGGAEAKQQLEGVADAAQKTGSGVQDMGTKALIGSGWVQKALSFLAGPLGFAGIAGAVAGGAIKIAQFFDEIKTRSDEAVLKVQEIRGAFAELFAVMDTYSEKSRQVLTLETTALLQRTAVTQQVGLPVVTAYARAFQPSIKRGEITEPQYQQGLEQMLRYAGRQGAGAVPQMIELMTGWEMLTPQRQGEFQRMLSAAAKEVGLSEEDLATALGKGIPAIKALGWTPEQAIIETAKIAATQAAPRARATMPANIFEAIMRPQIPKEFERKIPKEIREDPAKLFNWIRQQQRILPQKEYQKLLQDFYGGETGLGMFGWTTARGIGLERIIPEAAGPIGIAEVARAEVERQKTMEATVTKVETSGRYRRLETIREEKEMGARLREMGQIEQELREHPIRQKRIELLTIGKEAEKEEILYARWLETLTKEEKLAYEKEAHEQVLKGEYWIPDLIRWKWNQLSYKEKVQDLLKHTEEPPPPTVIYNDNHDFIVNPVIGNKADLMGPRTPKGIH